MAFTYDISTPRGQVRLQLSDTTSTSAVFDDAEIDYLLTKGGSVDGATVAGARVLLGNRALRVKRVSDKDKSYDDTKQLEGLKALIKTYGGMPLAIVSGPSCLPSDADYGLSSTST